MKPDGYVGGHKSRLGSIPVSSTNERSGGVPTYMLRGAHTWQKRRRGGTLILIHEVPRLSTPCSRHAEAYRWHCANLKSSLRGKPTLLSAVYGSDLFVH